MGKEERNYCKEDNAKNKEIDNRYMQPGNAHIGLLPFVRHFRNENQPVHHHGEADKDLDKILWSCQPKKETFLTIGPKKREHLVHLFTKGIPLAVQDSREFIFDAGQTIIIKDCRNLTSTYSKKMPIWYTL
ncbi:hypothetical protein [Desulfonatronospira sp.]|uniref:hypothetical protein n=1 Tax=Desulfonatronospira sp. TaxID=1962951 RepID=UPI0025BA3D14|nr:hypothetical protein [Desulfonatronospira sp.]